MVVLVPLAVYGVQQEMGLWLRDQLYRDYRWGDGRWLTMELALLAAGAAMLALPLPVSADADSGHTVVYIDRCAQLADLRQEGIP